LHETRLADSSGSGSRAATLRPGAASAAFERPGTVIGRYELLEQIGTGGFGVVFVAQQREPVQRQVALKVIKLGMDTQQVIARFERERQTLALMEHPNIARVLDAGATDAGRPYFVMELVPGAPITAYCDQQRLTIPARLALFIQVCSAVQHAHQKGVIHRDIKPSNVLVETHDGRAHPKVIDFGIAKVTTGADADITRSTGQLQMLGTPQYMSPEQAAGSAEFDTRTDVYSLGVVLYELLTGQTPFAAAELSSASYAEVQRLICEVEPPRASVRAAGAGAASAANRGTDPPTLARRLRGELDWIVARSLEKEPRRRYASPSELAADLQRYMSGEPVVAAPPSRAYRARKFVRRHRAAVASGAAMLALLLAGLGALSFAFVQVRAERDRTEEARREAQRQADIAEAINEFLNTDLLAAAAPAQEEARGRDATMGDVLDTAARRLDHDPAVRARFADMPVVEAAIRRTMAATYQALGDVQTAESQYARAVALLTEARGAADEETLRCQTELAAALRALGREDEAEAKLMVVRSALEHDPTGNAAGMARVLNDLSLIVRSRGEFARAEKLLLESQALAIAAGLDGHPDYLTSRENLALLHEDMGRYEEAEAILRDVVARRAESLGPGHVQTLTAQEKLGLVLIARGRFAEAEPLYLETLEVRRKVLGEDHPQTLVTKSNLGLYYWRLGQFPRALPLLEEVAAARRARHGPEHRDTLAALNNLASCYTSMGRPEEALAIRKETLEAERRLLGPRNPATLRSMNNLAVTYRDLERYDDAEALYREALAAREGELGPGHPDTLVTLENLGGVYFARGDMAGAEQIVRQVLERRRDALGEDHPAVTQTLYNLARITARQGDAESAIGLYRESLARFRTEFGEQHEYVAAALNGLAGLHRGRKEHDEAIPLYRAALDIHLTLDGAAHAHVADALFDLGATYVLNKSYDLAEPLLRQALEMSATLRGEDDVGTLNSRYGVAKLLMLTGRFAEAEPLARECHVRARTRFGEEHIQTRKAFELVGEVYDKWHAAEPGGGYDARAAAWRAAPPAP